MTDSDDWESERNALIAEDNYNKAQERKRFLQFSHWTENGDPPDDCEFCEGTGIVPCENCGESDDHTCVIDGEEYGPTECEH